MADNDNQITPQRIDEIRNDAPSPAPARRKSRPGKSGNASAGRRGGTKIDRHAPQHQARVLAMQALYEDDLTEHGLDAILQHMGQQERQEHGDYYSRLRSAARKAIEEIGFLARNADFDPSGTTVSRFHDASENVLGTVFEAPDPESEDGDLPDESVWRYRTGVENTLTTLLTTHRDSAERSLQQAVAADPAIKDPPGFDALANLEADAVRRLASTLAREERTSRESLMNLMNRAVALARGVDANRTGIDPSIEKAAPAFPIPQLASIDRAVLRIAVYELLFEPDVPFKAAINEGVEIAKRYGGPNSGRFVNGVLRTISEGLPESRKEQQPHRRQGRSGQDERG